MAQNVWTPTTGVYTLVGNWSLGTLPANGEDAVVPKDTTQGIESDAGGQAAVDLASFLVERGHNQDVATSGVPLTISAAELIHQGGGTLFFKAGTAKVDQTTINATPAEAGNKSASLSGTAASNDYGKIAVVRGDVDIESVTFTIDELQVGSVGSPASDVQINIKATNGLITDMIVWGGVVLLNRPVTRLTVAGGRVVIDDFVPVTVYQGGGVVEYMTPSAIDNIATYNLCGGTLDVTKAFQSKGIDTLILKGSPETTIFIEDRNLTLTNPRQDYRIAG